MMGRLRIIYAHTLPNQPESDWETLDVQAAEVARLTETFASSRASPASRGSALKRDEPGGDADRRSRHSGEAL